MDMHNDISKRTVLVLLVLTLVISVVGTWTVLSMPKDIHKTVVYNPVKNSQVKLRITDPTDIPEPMPPVATGAQVAISIVK